MRTTPAALLRTALIGTSSVETPISQSARRRLGDTTHTFSPSRVCPAGVNLADSLIPDTLQSMMSRIHLRGRHFYVVFDNDVLFQIVSASWENRNVISHFLSFMSIFGS